MLQTCIHKYIYNCALIRNTHHTTEIISFLFHWSQSWWECHFNIPVPCDRSYQNIRWALSQWTDNWMQWFLLIATSNKRSIDSESVSINSDFGFDYARSVAYQSTMRLYLMLKKSLKSPSVWCIQTIYKRVKQHSSIVECFVSSLHRVKWFKPKWIFDFN